MTLTEIAMFKHFCEGHALTKLYVSTYRNQVGRTNNPASIEAFLSNVEPHLVIKGAIKYYAIKSAFGFDWWDGKNKLWLEYMEEQSMNGGYTPEQEKNLFGLYKILRQNWDAPRFWERESTEAAKKRLGLVNPDLDQEEFERELEACAPQEEKDDSDELEFFDLGKKKPSVGTLKDNEVTLNCRNDKFSLTFNKYYTSILRNRKYQKCDLARTKSGDIVLYLNSERGVNVYRGERNVSINSKNLCQCLKTLLNVSEDYKALHIEQIEDTGEIMKLKIFK